jgi:hypothetical protein
MSCNRCSWAPRRPSARVRLRSREVAPTNSHERDGKDGSRPFPARRRPGGQQPRDPAGPRQWREQTVTRRTPGRRCRHPSAPPAPFKRRTIGLVDITLRLVTRARALGPFRSIRTKSHDKEQACDWQRVWPGSASWVRRGTADRIGRVLPGDLDVPFIRRRRRTGRPRQVLATASVQSNDFKARTSCR